MRYRDGNPARAGFDRPRLSREHQREAIAFITLLGSALISVEVVLFFVRSLIALAMRLAGAM